jgi:glycerol-3-phosphate dehydrogenase (NAD(P)+)
MRAAVMGAGSWGTTFAQVLCDAGTSTVLYGRTPELAKAISELHENPDYLPGITLAPELAATADPAEALSGADLVVFAVPAQSLRANLAEWAPLIPPGSLLVSLIKGIELGTCRRMSEVIVEVLGADSSRVAVVTGPNLAGEIVMRQVAATVVACTEPGGALALQGACHTPYFRPYTNSDVVGCELGGTVKNIIAIAVGIAVAMGLGDNTKATLITRGLAEMARLGSALGAQPQTFSGLAGMGDLVATCSSPLSRNRTFGENLGRGLSVASAAAVTGQTAEGVASSGPVLELARAHGVEMPITEVVEAVMRDGLPVGEAAAILTSRSAKPEWYGPRRRGDGEAGSPPVRGGPGGPGGYGGTGSPPVRGGIPGGRPPGASRRNSGHSA